VWVYGPNGELRNPRSDLCLDGTTLTLQDCTGAAGQQWTIPAG
jgi:hypothetical protein